jgi:hypothetical protein
MSGLETLIVPVGAGLVVYEVVKFQEEHQPAKTSPNPGGTVVNPAGAGIKGTVFGKVATSNQSRISTVNGANQTMTGVAAGTAGGSSAQIDAAIEAQRRKLEQKVAADYNKLAADAKAKGAAAISKTLKLDPPLTGKETWDQLQKRLKAAGAAAGVAACNVVPGVGTAASPLCAIAGAYLGAKISDFIKAHWDDVKDFAEKEWDSLSGKISDVAHDAYDWVTGIW